MENIFVMNKEMKRIIGFICGVLTIVAFFAMIGIAGSVDCDSVTLAEATPKFVVGIEKHRM